MNGRFYERLIGEAVFDVGRSSLQHRASLDVPIRLVLGIGLGQQVAGQERVHRLRDRCFVPGLLGLLFGACSPSSAHCSFCSARGLVPGTLGLPRGASESERRGGGDQQRGGQCHLMAA